MYFVFVVLLFVTILDLNVGASVNSIFHTVLIILIITDEGDLSGKGSKVISKALGSHRSTVRQTDLQIENNSDINSKQEHCKKSQKIQRKHPQTTGLCHFL